MYKLTVSCKGKMTPSQIKSDWVSSLGDRIGGDLEVKLACGKTKTVQLESMCRKEVPAGLRTWSGWSRQFWRDGEEWWLEELLL